VRWPRPRTFAMSRDRLRLPLAGPDTCRPRRGIFARMRDWWDLRRGRVDRILARMDPLGEPGGAVGGAPVREPRRPLRPTLSGSVTLDLPED
jgi:hypothetical protein